MCARDAGAVRTRITPGVVPTTALPEEQGARSAACVAFREQSVVMSPQQWLKRSVVTSRR